MGPAITNSILPCEVLEEGEQELFCLTIELQDFYMMSYK